MANYVHNEIRFHDLKSFELLKSLMDLNNHGDELNLIASGLNEDCIPFDVEWDQHELLVSFSTRHICPEESIKKIVANNCLSAVLFSEDPGGDWRFEITFEKGVEVSKEDIDSI